ncbi:MAG: Na(+)-translocating NADH-quinone reductase subunit C [Bacteroidetes bacterium]|nr:Na(+)-translocating NADH-quinone reductase subunit C [Bacteroidota bacterium]
MSADSTKKTLMVALGVCLVCSVLVSSATVALSDRQEENKKLDKLTNILAAGDLLKGSTDVQKTYEENIQAKLIDVKTGEILNEKQYTKDLNPETFDTKKMTSDPKFTELIPSEIDIAGIKKLPKHMVIYEVMKDKVVDKFIFPIYGKGLWSTLWGFVALDTDLRTIKGFTFYEHGETPGLGGEVDNPKWKAQWKGKKAFDENGDIAISVIKGTVDQSNPKAEYQIDGLSGSTLTSRGVSNLVRFWLGENGYGPFMAKVKEGQHE